MIAEVLSDEQLSDLSEQLRAFGYRFQFISEEDRPLHDNRDMFWQSKHSRNVLFWHPDGHIKLATLAKAILASASR